MKALLDILPPDVSDTVACVSPSAALFECMNVTEMLLVSRVIYSAAGDLMT